MAAGQASVGREFSGEIGWFETVMYWPLTHQIAPSEMAVECQECHTTDGRLDFAALGFPQERVDVLTSFPPVAPEPVVEELMVEEAVVEEPVVEETVAEEPIVADHADTAAEEEAPASNNTLAIVAVVIVVVVGGGDCSVVWVLAGADGDAVAGVLLGADGDVVVVTATAGGKASSTTVLRKSGEIRYQAIAPPTTPTTRKTAFRAFDMTTSWRVAANER